MILFFANKQLVREGIILLCAFIFIILLEYVGVGRMIKNGGMWVFEPVQVASVNIAHKLRQPYIMIMHVNKAARRIQDLELKYAASSAALGELDALRAENQALKSLLENSDRTLEESMIITTPILSFAQPAIASGSNDGVREGSLILSSNTLLGVVDRVSENQAIVSLLTQRSTQPILATTESGVQGLIVGDGRRVLLTEIPIDEEVELNQRVVTVGQKGVKRGIFIGRVVMVQSKPSSSAKVAILEPLVSFYESVIVEVQ